MKCDYDEIRHDNERRYGTDIGRIGPMLLADRYDDRTHFIYELLQNAEDASAKRGPWTGKRLVRFHLGLNALRVSHFGKPFDEPDVRGVCGIAESTKDLTAIGRFGIGFKSVYAFTDRPEVYSGNESFAIESFVWPVATDGIRLEPDETVVVLPLRVPSERTEIEAGLRRLGPASLLFLRAVEEIEWSVEGGLSGLYLRSPPEWLDDLTRRITVIGQTAGYADVEESWLIFAKSVHTPEGDHAGHVEVAFSLGREAKSERETVRPVSRSPLVVFFPTALETHLGFLIQGPYRTTPSRDNVPAQDAWNRHCVAETATVLSQALVWLRDNGKLDASALRCLPLARAKFPEGAMFTPIFDAVRNTLADEALLPRHRGGYISARQGRLARSQELRELLADTQLTTLFGDQTGLAWLSGDISQDRTPELREYLIEELQIDEIRPETLLPKLSAAFLEAQPDEWMRLLYEFLGDQKAMLARARELPLVRLRDGKHVRAKADGQPQAFLPGPVDTDFPTVRRDACASEAARSFLRSLELTEPDPVDDVVRNVLPKYGKSPVSKTQYESDIKKIIAAYTTDSVALQDKLKSALRNHPFVMVTRAKDDKKYVSKPSNVYIDTDRLRTLLAGVDDIYLTDSSYSCLRGEDIRTIMEACDAVRYLRPIKIDNSLSYPERAQLREQTGHLETSGYNDRDVDWKLLGLDKLIDILPTLSPHERQKRAALIWEELANLEERRGKGIFSGEYTWTHRGNYRAGFDASFVKILKKTAWVPDGNGELRRPELIIFESLGWKPHPFLLSKIHFKPAIIDQLAREAGLEPGMLDLLKKLGITSESQLREHLVGVDETPSEPERKSENVEDALRNLGVTDNPTSPVPAATAGDPKRSEGPIGGDGGRHSGSGDGVGSGTHSGTAGAGGGTHSGGGGGMRTPGSTGGRPFISYVGTHPDDEGPDLDGLDQNARIALEAKAIELIRSREPQWQPTPTNNPGFDLFESGPDGRPVRWCEVKAMTGGLENRPVGLSRTQFDCGREHGSDYWLYIVERAGTDLARIVRIQDPAGRSRTFTFDRGWLEIAEVDPGSVGHEG